MTKESDPKTGGVPVPGVERAVRILDLLSTVPTPLGLSDISRRLGLPKSSVFNLCGTLVHLGLLSVTEHNQFRMGAHALAWANSFQRQSSLTAEFHNICATRDFLTDDALNLTIPQKDSVLYVACLSGSAPLSVRFEVGMSLPMLFTATGKAMLASLSEERLRERVSTKWPERPTQKSVASYEALLQELEETRQRGCSVERGQLREGMVCFGAPIFESGNSEAVAGLAVGVIEAQLTDENYQTYTRDIRRLADAISRALGGNPELWDK